MTRALRLAVAAALPSFLLTISFASAIEPTTNTTDTFLGLPQTPKFLVRQAPGNLQTFTNALGNSAAPPITNSGVPDRVFAVDTDTFTDFDSAAQRSCDRQFDACQRAANAEGAGFSVDDCNKQKSDCSEAQTRATVKSFDAQGARQDQNQNAGTGRTENIGPDPLFPDFDLICDA